MSDSSSSTASSSSTPSSSSRSSSRSSSSPSPRRAPPSNPDLHDPHSDEEYAPSPSLLAAYDGLMASLLPPLPSLPPLPPALVPGTAAPAPATAPAPTAGDGEEEAIDYTHADGRPMTKAEKQNAKKKRRKERERMLKAAAAAAKGESVEVGKKEKDEEEAIPFRLFSSLAPVSLSTTETYPLPLNPRLRPLPPSVQGRIHTLALEASIDPSSLPPPPSCSGDPDEGLDEWVADLSTLPKKSRGHSGGVPPAFRAFTRDVESACVAFPSIRLRPAGHQEEEEEEEEDAGRRKRRRRAYREFPVAQFWSPPEGVLPRGWGRAYGYGSRV